MLCFLSFASLHSGLAELQFHLQASQRLLPSELERAPKVRHTCGNAPTHGLGSSPLPTQGPQALLPPSAQGPWIAQNLPLLKPFNPRTSPFTQTPKIKLLDHLSSSIAHFRMSQHLVQQSSLPSGPRTFPPNPTPQRWDLHSHIQSPLTQEEDHTRLVLSSHTLHQTQSYDVCIPELFSKVLRYSLGSLVPPTLEEGHEQG